MSLQIDDLDQLRQFLNTVGVKPGSVDELHDLMQTINQTYNPDHARLRVAKLLAVVPPAVSSGVAGVVSFFLTATLSDGRQQWILIPSLAIVWGAVALICIMAVLCSWLTTRKPVAAQTPAPAQAKPRPMAATPSGEAASRSAVGIITADQR